MKVLHISTYDTGGAAASSIRLHKALLQAGIDSKVLVLDDTGKQFAGKVNYRSFAANNPLSEALFLAKRYYTVWQANAFSRKYPSLDETFTGIKSFFDITEHPDYLQADIIHLGFTSHFLDWESFFKKNKKPLIWTFHDTAVPGAGFHSIKDHNKYKNDFRIKKIIDREDKIIKQCKKLMIVTPSNWLSQFSKKSIIFHEFDHKVIPQGFDLSIFKPVNKNAAKDVLGLDKSLIYGLFAAEDHSRLNKGFQYLQALNKKINKNRLKFITIGNELKDFDYEEAGIISLGKISGEFAMAAAYSAVDFSIVLSGSESFSLVTAESFACGTPVIAFDTTGPAELIENGKDGILVAYDDIDALSNILACADKEKLSLLGLNAMEKAKLKFDIVETSREYIKCYEKMMRTNEQNIRKSEKYT